MLHAVNRKKARLNAFRGAGQRVPLEDLVTSTILGPLLFLEQVDAEMALSGILSSLGIRRPDWVGPAHLSLWPKRKTIATLRSNYVEPDAEFVDALGNSLVVEVKWGAKLSEFELAAQWLSLSADARATSRHLLIVLEPYPYQAAIACDRQEISKHCGLPWPIQVVSWRRMADAFREIGHDMRLSSGTRRWAHGVHGFLRREDPRSLAGWDGMELIDVPENSWRYNDGWFGQVADVGPIAWGQTR